jgi:type III secretory pathway component EscT
MQYIDDTTTTLILFSFTVIILVFLTDLMLGIIAKFFNKIFNIGKKNDFTRKN